MKKKSAETIISDGYYNLQSWLEQNAAKFKKKSYISEQ